MENSSAADLFAYRPPHEPTPAELARAAFARFDAENPQIWFLFERFALQAIAAGRKRLGGRLIAERIRWEVMVSTVSDDDLKLNDHFTPFYVRKFVAAHPKYRDRFELRAALADSTE